MQFSTASHPRLTATPRRLYHTRAASLAWENVTSLRARAQLVVFKPLAIELRVAGVTVNGRAVRSDQGWGMRAVGEVRVTYG